MMSTKDFAVYSMPSLLTREVLREDPSSGRWIRDDAWYSQTRERFYSLFKFFQERGLVVRRLVETQGDVDGVVLNFSELTALGQEFVMARADERWLTSFDRPGIKKQASDWTYLEKQLKKIEDSR